MNMNTPLDAQFNMAKLVPGKEEFHETIRYFKARLKALGVDVRLGARVSAVSARPYNPIQSNPS